MFKKYIFLILMIIGLLGGIVFYITHRSIDQELTQEALEIREVLQKTQTLQTDGETLENQDNWVVVVKEGVFNPDAQGSDSLHRGWGWIQIVEYEWIKRIVFWEDFKVTNAPDMYIYLVKGKSIETKEAFELAEKKYKLTRIQQFSGYQVYDIPSDVDISEYQSLVLWCDAFSVYMSSANLK